MNKFQELQEKYPTVNDENVTELLRDNGIEDINDYLVFADEEDKEHFKETYHILQDQNTVELILDDINLIGQTIDGEYLLSDGHGILLSDVSFDKNMVERFEGMKPLQFLSDYVEGQIHSNVLAPVEE